jgi:hypothetical protein
MQYNIQLLLDRSRYVPSRGAPLPVVYARLGAPRRQGGELEAAGQLFFLSPEDQNLS